MFAQDVPYGMKAYVLWKYRLGNDLSMTCQYRQLKLNPLSTQINIYCLMTNQTPALLVQPSREKIGDCEQSNFYANVGLLTRIIK